MNEILGKKRENRQAAQYTDKIPFIADIILNSTDKNIIQKVYLFGSYAYGVPTEESDIDIFVITDVVFDRLTVYGNMMGALRKNGLCSCDLIVSNEADFQKGIQKNIRGIENTIIKQGRLLYEQ